MTTYIMRNYSLLLGLLVVTAQFGLGMAVDRSKFRTCEKTSFCRRHRGKHSARLYQYRLDKNSIHFHQVTHQNDNNNNNNGADGEGGGSTTTDSKDSPETGEQNVASTSRLWASIQRRILGSKDSSGGTGGGRMDPYVRGPPPTVTGTLINTAKETSSGNPEQLQWSVHALAHGVVRMRITETYGGGSSRFSKARVTYDDLVLTNPGSLEAASHVEWLTSHNISSKDQEAIWKKLVPAGADRDNYVGLLYGDAHADSLLWVRLSPFAVYYHRVGSDSGGGDDWATPAITLGTQEMTHFEIRRSEKGDKDVKPAITTTEEEGDETKKNDATTDEKKPEKEIVGYWEDGLAIYSDGTREERKAEAEEDHRHLTEAELDREGLWDEHFGGTHHDTKPHGPMSVGMDITFPQSKHLFGLPEHASSAILQNTIGDNSHYHEPYRLYNLDVFEYELDETMALYGNVPLVISQSIKTGTSGVFWFNPTETYVDVMDQEEDNNSNSNSNSKTTHWMSESGIIDIFLMRGPTPQDLYSQYSMLTGTTQLPPMFSLGYHQCRWNYKDEKDVYFVHDKFEELDYPYDVLWLDIEHTDGKRYFTWDDNLFPHPREMQEKLFAQGRRMVTIVDPHIKRDDKYYIHKEATAKGLYIKDKSGQNDYDGWCWPGSSSYLDFTNEKVRSWWADQFGYDRYKGSSPSLFTWNDMNEPSVFNGPEVSMQKDLLNLAGVEHREWHNLYGMLFHRSTMEGLIRRNQPDANVRPFVLSRAFYAGSQKYGAIWTGDNTAEWSHLEIAAPMLLSLNIGAISFVGADVGGFFGNPDAELMTRWMQAGAYQPFFRGHAHHDAKRREPWMFGDETMVRLRKATMARYALLPYWYTVFRESALTGFPVMRTMWMQYPKTELLFSEDDQYLIGSDLLVKPVVKAGITQTSVKFPTNDVWYDAETLVKVSPKGAQADGVTVITVSSNLDQIPVYQRGGSVIPRKLRLRRSAALMRKDPYTLYMALDDAKTASGTLYMDDEESFDYERKGEFAEASFTADFNGAVGTIGNAISVGAGWEKQLEIFESERMVERIVVMGVTFAPKTITCNDRTLEFQFSETAQVLVIRKPGVSALNDWELTVTWT